MKRLFRFVAFFVLGTAVLVACLALGGFVGLLGLILVTALYGWMAYAFLHYRHTRQEEVQRVLMTAGAAQLPLGPALWAYLRDRPLTPWREFWAALLLFFVLPGYYWIWHRRHRFDVKVERVARALDAGYPLVQALRAAPGVVSRETILAAAIGETTGDLSASLERAPRWQIGPLWLETAPRFIYPVALLLFVNGVLAFLVIFIFPKYEKIFLDFKVRLPAITTSVLSFGRILGEYWFVPALCILGLVAGGALVASSSTILWHAPLLGRLYRGYARGRFLTMLAMLLKANRPVPEALAILSGSGFFGDTVRRRIDAVLREISQGKPLPESLYSQGLLPRHMAPLVQAAERAHSLPWALEELGGTLARRVIRGAHRLTMTLFPILVFLTGALVAFVIFGAFMPLLTLLTELNQ